MKLTNHSPYDGRVIKLIATVIYNTMAKTEGKKSWWKYFRVYVYTGRGDVELPRDVSIRLPKLNGLEWVWYTRERAGREIPEDIISRKDRPPLREEVALEVFKQILQRFGVAFDWQQHDVKYLGGGPLARVPRFIPLRKKLRQPKPPVDRAAQRRQRIEAKMKTWLKKQKLAATKVKKYRTKLREHDWRLLKARARDRAQEAREVAAAERAAGWDPKP